MRVTFFILQVPPRGRPPRSAQLRQAARQSGTLARNDTASGPRVGLCTKRDLSSVAAHFAPRSQETPALDVRRDEVEGKPHHVLQRIRSTDLQSRRLAAEGLPVETNHHRAKLLGQKRLEHRFERNLRTVVDQPPGARYEA